MKPAPIARVFAALILLSAGTALAQRSTNLRLGFTASPTFGRITYDDTAPYASSGTRVGFSYGIIADYAFAGNYYLGTGFLLTTMRGDVRTATEEFTYRTQYIEVPLTLKLKTGTDGPVRFYGQFGPDLGVKISHKHNLTTNPLVERDAELIRLGLLIGAGAEWRFRGAHLLTGVSYLNPFTPVFRQPDAKNPGITLNLGLFF